MGLNGTRSKNLSPIAVLQNGTPTPFGPYNNIKVLVVVWAPVHANIVLGARTPNGKQHSTVRHFCANINHVVEKFEELSCYRSKSIEISNFSL